MAAKLFIDGTFFAPVYTFCLKLNFISLPFCVFRICYVSDYFYYYLKLFVKTLNVALLSRKKQVPFFCIVPPLPKNVLVRSISHIIY